MKRSSIGEFDYFVAWLVFFLCSTIAGAVAGFIGGAIVGAILAAAGGSREVIGALAGITGLILALPVSYLIFRVVVGKLIVAKMEVAASHLTPSPSPGAPLPE